MCGRYFIDMDTPNEELEEIIEKLQRKTMIEPFKTGEIFPSDCVPVIANNRRLESTPFVMQWGYSLPGGKRIINARSESAAQKMLFRDGMQNRRCLIVASNYFEWRKNDGCSDKYAIRARQKGPMYMAGIYRMENGRAEFSVLTREPAADIAFIHNRMPVIVPREMKSDWLNPRYNAADLLRSALTDVEFNRA